MIRKEIGDWLVLVFIIVGTFSGFEVAWLLQDLVGNTTSVIAALITFGGIVCGGIVILMKVEKYD